MRARSSSVAFTSSEWRAQNEERDDVDRGIGLEPHAQRAHVVRGAPGDVKHAHAITRDVERDEAAIVVGDSVAIGSLDGDLDDARPRAIERDRELDGGRAHVRRARRPRRAAPGGPPSMSSRARRP